MSFLKLLVDVTVYERRGLWSTAPRRMVVLPVELRPARHFWTRKVAHW
jgi:hypothetical protein